MLATPAGLSEADWLATPSSVRELVTGQQEQILLFVLKVAAGLALMNKLMPTTTGRLTQDIVAKLWNLCNVLKDDWVTYHQYVSELTYLLFLKMAKETGTEAGIPEEWR